MCYYTITGKDRNPYKTHEALGGPVKVTNTGKQQKTYNGLGRLEKVANSSIKDKTYKGESELRRGKGLSDNKKPKRHSVGAVRQKV